MYSSEVPSLRRKRMQQRSANDQVSALRTAQRVGRTTQAAHSTIAVGDADVPLVDAVDTAVTVGSDLPGVEGEAGQAGTDSWEAWEKAQDAGEGVDVALAAAEAASEDALAAKTTADGKNRIFAQMIEPVAHPEIPFVAGDLWYETDSSGRFVNVHVWNESEAEFVQHRIVASSVLVPGSVGPVLIEDGAVTAPKLATNALNFKTAEGMTLLAGLITGALIRTAPSGQRLQLDVDGLTAYNGAGAVAARITPADSGMTVVGTGAQADLVSFIAPQRFETKRELVSGGSFTEQEIANMYRGWVRTLYRKFSAPSVEDKSSLAEMVTSDFNSTIREARAKVQSVKAGQGAGSVELYARPDTASVEITQGGRALYMGRAVVNSAPVWMIRAEDLPLHVDAPEVALAGDTDWANATLPSGVTGTARWRRYLGVIYVQYNVTSSSAIASDALLQPAFTLPAAAIPEVNSALGVVGQGTRPGIAWVSASSGNCVIRNTHSGSIAQFYGAGQWPAPGL